MQQEHVQTWMSPNPNTIQTTATLDEAYQLMEKLGVRHLPVVSGQRLIGLISKSDIHRAQLNIAASYDRREMQEMVARHRTVGEIVLYAPPTITAADLITTAAQIMLDKHLTALPVMENNHLVGILTESDIFRVVIQSGRQPAS